LISGLSKRDIGDNLVDTANKFKNAFEDEVAEVERSPWWNIGRRNICLGEGGCASPIETCENFRCEMVPLWTALLGGGTIIVLMCLLCCCCSCCMQMLRA
jgi:hypothetical protein